ncbi:MAG: tetratricopeptide repeat protein, partial [Thaumarchaeota archaeon]|nr:tetratricopeptide repeat protein [Nitrososphaerota archaeon]
NQVDEAKAYYEQHVSKKRTYRLMGRLASTYFDSGAWDSTIKTYRLILVDEPNDQDAPAYQANIVKAFANQGPGQRQHVREELKTLVDKYKPSSEWANANSHNKVALANAYDLSEGSMRELVTEYHAEAQRTKSVATYRLARDLYKEYLTEFPDSENSYSLRFYYAEILWALEQWSDAADQYTILVQKDPKGTYAKSSSYDTLLCYDKLVAIDQGKLTQRELSDNEKIDETKKKGTVEKETKRLQTATTNIQETPLTKWEGKLVEAGDNYVRLFPDTADESNILYKAAVIYYDHYHYVEAAHRFGAVITKFPSDKNAQYAANLTLHALEVKEEWEALNTLARAFAKNKFLNKGEFAKDLQKLIEGSQFKYDMLVYEKKDYDKSATLFAEFVKEFPKSQYAPKALFNSLVMFEQAKKLDQAITVGEKLVHDYPTSDLVLRTIGALGRDYELTADFANAAREYEAFANKDPKDPKAADNLFNAALWNEGLGNFD